MRSPRRSFHLVALAVATMGALATLGAAACQDAPPASQSPPGPTPDSFRVAFATSRGTFVVQVNRAWAPLGADRFYALVNTQ